MVARPWQEDETRLPMTFRVLSALQNIVLGPTRGFRAGATAAYMRAVTQSRAPAFYHAGVADDPEGRFDVLALHVYALLRRLRGAPDAKPFGQALFDVMAADIDANLREMGVGDSRIPKKVREHAEWFYGRSAAYDSALEDGAAPEALDLALGRNLFGREDHPAAPALARYARAMMQALDRQEASELMAGDVRFPDPDELAPTRGATAMGDDL